jgi:PqqD family protein of HPr-rel-A system
MYSKRRDDLVVRAVDDERLVLDPRNGEIHQLNTTAAQIWDMCDGHTSEQAMARRLAEDYGIELAAAVCDVRALLERFEDLALLETGG